MSSTEQEDSPWSGVPWADIEKAYEDIYRRWKADESVEPPLDCPLDDLLPAMLDTLSPELQDLWTMSDRLFDAGYEEEGMRLTHEVFDRSGFSKVVEIRWKMGALD